MYVSKSFFCKDKGVLFVDPRGYSERVEEFDRWTNRHADRYKIYRIPEGKVDLEISPPLYEEEMNEESIFDSVDQIYSLFFLPECNFYRAFTGAGELDFLPVARIDGFKSLEDVETKFRELRDK